MALTSSLPAVTTLAGFNFFGYVGTASRQAPATLLSDAFQPKDADLTAIAALTTSSFGRGLLTLADAAALAGNHVHTFASISEKPTTLAGHGITNGARIEEVETEPAVSQSFTVEVTAANGSVLDGDYFDAVITGGTIRRTWFNVDAASTAPENPGELLEVAIGGTSNAAAIAGALVTAWSSGDGGFDVGGPAGALVYFARRAGGLWPVPSSPSDGLNIGVSNAGEDAVHVPALVQEHLLPSLQHAMDGSGFITLADGRQLAAVTALEDGDFLTGISAAKITSGSLALARIAAGGASTNQVLTYNGTAWAPAAPASTGLTNGSTAIASGTSGRILYNNAGTLGELDTTGSGSVVRATSPALVTPALGTPSSGTLTSCTGLPVSTGISGLGTGVATWLSSGSKAALDTLLGSTLLTSGGALGTPASGTLTSCTGLPVSTGISGLGSGVATWLASGSKAALDTLLGSTLATTGANTFTAAQTITGGTLATATLSVSQTWNSAGATCRGLEFAVTNTASASASTLIRILGGSTGTTSRLAMTEDKLTITGAESTGRVLDLVSTSGTAFFTVTGGGTLFFNNGAHAVAANGEMRGAAVGNSAQYLGVLYDTGSALACLRPSTSTVQLGVGAASPVAYTLRGASARAGTDSNVAGASLTLAGGNGTGTGGGGKLIFQTAPVGSSGSAANTLTTAMEIDRDRVLFIANAAAAPSGTPSGGGFFYVESGALKFKGSSGTVTTLAPT